MCFLKRGKTQFSCSHLFLSFFLLLFLAIFSLSVLPFPRFFISVSFFFIHFTSPIFLLCFFLCFFLLLLPSTFFSLHTPIFTPFFLSLPHPLLFFLYSLPVFSHSFPCSFSSFYYCFSFLCIMYNHQSFL